MTDELREFLYPLGFLSAFVFGARFILQWIQSEMQGKSIVTKTFWKLSIIGNISLVFHSILQSQFHICIIQACNAVISWRNFNLMQNSKPSISFKTVIFLLISVATSVTVFFILQNHLSSNETSWFRVPTAPWQNEKIAPINFIWHLIGSIGYILFSSRFWIQWLLTEKFQKSYLPPSFWWLSLIGSILSCAYFIRIQDTVNLIGPVIGFIPYLRNLMLIYKTEQSTTQT
ncbi:MAG: lipid-A-disaccharide synthase N-terminal domain-containing protein [Parachlamydiaceae bacterium]|nr:lipid-A-disaccharide synthase N-terminal domain-containing protein [Parachlamydiaceae bacterium]